jgi:hypothetical protein
MVVYATNPYTNISAAKIVLKYLMGEKDGTN